MSNITLKINSLESKNQEQKKTGRVNNSWDQVGKNYALVEKLELFTK